MTKTELIKKFARNSGVPDSEARIFFEVFLRKLESRLNLKQVFKIPDIGSFKLKKDYIKSKAGMRELNVISFLQHIDSEEELIFHIPDEPELYSSLDPYFSLSFGKPVIPLEGTESTEFFIPHSGAEYEKLLESKVEKLLTHGGKAEEDEKSFKPQPLPEKEFHRQENKEINWKSVPSSFKERGLKEQTPSEDNENISWDFGKGFEDEAALEELEDKTTDTIPDKTEEPEAEKEIHDSYPDNKVDITDETGQTEYPDEIEQTQYESLSEETGTEQHEEQIEKKEVSNEYISSVPEEIKPALFPVNDYEKVEPLIASLQKVEEEFVSEEKTPLSNNEESPEEKGNIIDEKGYIRVIPKVTPLLKMKEEEQEKLVPPVDKTGIPLEEEISEENILDKDEFEEESDFTEKKGKTKRWLVVVGIFAALVVISGGIYLYTYYLGDKSPDTVVTPPKVKDRSHAVIIERSYDYPVTYPYNKNTIVGLFDGVNPDLIKPALVKEQPQSSGIVPETENYTARPSKFVKGYIFEYNGFYAVQVSSWKSLSIAKSEMMKYRNGGLNAFIEEAQVKGNTYYRVRVGFKTLEEVEAYLAK
jgi:hypothetical protein